MSDPLEQLENELRGLRPLEPAPTVRQGMAARLADESSVMAIRRRRRLRFYGPAAAGLVAACVALSFWLWPTDSATGPEVPIPSAKVTTPQPGHDSILTWTACRMAANRSPEAFLALLDENADRILIPEKPIVSSAWSTLLKNDTINQ